MTYYPCEMSQDARSGEYYVEFADPETGERFLRGPKRPSRQLARMAALRLLVDLLQSLYRVDGVR